MPFFFSVCPTLTHTRTPAQSPLPKKNDWKGYFRSKLEIDMFSSVSSRPALCFFFTTNLFHYSKINNNKRMGGCLLFPLCMSAKVGRNRTQNVYKRVSCFVCISISVLPPKPWHNLTHTHSRMHKWHFLQHRAFTSPSFSPCCHSA